MSLVHLILTSLLLLSSRTFAEEACDENFLYEEGMGCLHFSAESQNLTFAEAQEYCEDVGGVLVQVYNERIQGRILEQGANTALDFWVGATDAASEGTYIWASSETDLGFTAWSEGEPNGGTAQNCIASTLEHFYFWSDEDCERKYGMQAVCSANTKVRKCPGYDWLYSEEMGTCYFPYIQENVNAAIMDFTCEEFSTGSYPANLETPEENAVVQGFLDAYNAAPPTGTTISNIWIGLTDVTAEGTYIWEESRDPATYDDWVTFYSPLDSSDCVIMFGAQYWKWNESPCLNEYPVLCEIAAVGI